MDLARLYDELARAAAKIGVEVREEPFDPGLRDARVPRGGLCVIRGQRVIIVDAGAALPDRVGMLARALGDVDLDGVFLAPVVRATIALHRSGEANAHDTAEAQPLARTKGRPDQR